VHRRGSLRETVEYPMFEAPRQFTPAALASADFPAAPFARIDFVEICAALWRGRTTILTTTVVALLAAAVFVLAAPHRFTAVTEILIDPVDLRAVANEATPSIQASDTALLLIDSQVRVLTSDNVLRRVVESQGLAHDREFAATRSPPGSLEDAVLAAFGRGSLPAAADPSLTALNALKRHIQVTRAERTYVVSVAVSSEEPAKAARLANAVAQAYLAEQTAVRADAARQISQSLTARLNDLKNSVEGAEERVQAFKARHNIVDANGQLVNEQQLSDLDLQLASARARTAAAKGRLDQIEAVQRSNTDIGAFPEAVQSPTITALRTQYAEIMRLQAQQVTSLGARHPAVIEIQAQAERLKQMIGDEVNRIALAARADYESAKANEDLLTRNVDGLKQNTLATDAEMVNLRELERDVQANRAVYEAFLVRARETGEQELIDTKNIHVISKADLPLSRSFPPANAIVALAAIFIGFASGAGLVLLRAPQGGTLPRRVGEAAPRPFGAGRWNRWSAAAARPEFPILAQVPAVDVAFGVDSVDDPTSRFAAGIRSVYAAVCATNRERGRPSVLIVACDDADDTAAVALSLAALSAETQDVLLIDADLDHRTLSAIDADDGEAGLVDVAVGRRRLADAVVHDRDTNINVIPFVSAHSFRDRAIEDADVRVAFAQTQDFDMVVVAATGMSADPGIRFFADVVDHIVLVASADERGARDIDAFVSRLGLDARKIRGAVLTMAEAA
jgi:polysaccharide biosynthesis transport protein